jgi:hypothetical protein
MVFRAISESRNEFHLIRSDSSSSDSIGVKADLYRDSEARKQSAMFLVDGDKTTNNSKVGIGGEWNLPVYLYNNTTQNGDIGYKAAAISLGFVAKSNNLNFPFRFSLGPAFEGGLNNNLHSRDTAFGAGGYFSLSGGDTLGSRIADSPFLFDGEIFGKYIKSQNDHNNTTAKSKLVFERNGIFQSDSFFISLSDTIGYGKINSQFGYINGFRGEEVPSRYSNNLSLVIRATEIGEAFFEPSFEIRLTDNRYRYISSEKFYGSLKKNTASILGFVNKNLGYWEFETGMIISGTREENCYLSDPRRVGGGSQIDTLNEKLKNAEIFNPQYYFLAEYLSPNERVGLSAQYSVERNRRIYPFSYEQNGVSFSSNDDFDNLANLISLQTEFYLTDWYNLFFSSEFLAYQINYLKSRMSAASRKEERIAFGIGNVFSKDTSVILTLRGNAVAVPQRYHFAKTEGVMLPTHNRTFSFASDLALSYGGGWSNLIEFFAARFDKGIIYDEIYYGVEEKKYETISSVSLAKSARVFVVASGLEVRTTQSYRFDHFENDYVNRGLSYLFSPFLSGNFAFDNNVLLHFYVKNNINRGQSSSRDFWDVSLNLSAFF